MFDLALFESDEVERVLVVVMNNKRDFAIARDEGWYRIPVKRAPMRVGADYLAFYQTKVFGNEGYAVNYYAPVRRYHILSRRELLPEEANHSRAADEYYKIEIGALGKLPQPILSQRLRRITFIPTTLDKLLTAKEINDLWLGSALEEQLWQLFKDNGISAERRHAVREDNPNYVIPFAIFCQVGKVAVLFEEQERVDAARVVREYPAVSDYDLRAAGWTVLRATERDDARNLQRIRQAITDCGGLAVV